MVKACYVLFEHYEIDEESTSSYVVAVYLNDVDANSELAHRQRTADSGYSYTLETCELK